MKQLIRGILLHCPIIGTYLKFRCTPTHNKSFRSYLMFLIRPNKQVYWPRHKNNKVANPQNITIGYNSSIGGSGTYIQGNGRLIIGNNIQTGTNVGILSGNHNVYRQFEQDQKTTIIGDYSWIGMGAIILPGVELGPRTIVGAGSVVTKSFPEGFCIVAGNPAKKIKDLNRELFEPHDVEYRFYGYVPAERFERFKKKHLKRR